MIAEHDDPILITGAAGFIGSRVVANLLDRGFRRLRCLVRPGRDTAELQGLQRRYGEHADLSILRGNLLSSSDSAAAVGDAAVIYHLAAGRGEKSIPDAFLNSVVATRNLLECARLNSRLRRIVCVSSFSVYSNRGPRNGRVLDETSEVEPHPERRGDAYSFAKVRQEQLVADYGRRFGLPYVIVRPGVVYGPGNHGIPGRVGIGTFGLFLHLGGRNPVPLTYVDNCADAIVLAGLQAGVDGEAFNVVDDSCPSSRRFLRLYKRHVHNFPSLPVPKWMSFILCYLWEKYSTWSEGQLPPAFNRLVWHAYWKYTCYSNEKLKRCLGWAPRIAPETALGMHFQSCRAARA